MRYSFNINANAVRDIARLRQIMQAIKPNSAFVMDGVGLAIDLLPYLSGDKIMIHRFYSPQEGDYWQLTPPDKAFNEIWYGGANQYADRLYFSVNNEPSHGNPGKGIKELLQWNIELMDIAHKKGVRLAIGEFAVGKTIEKSDVDNGVWDDFLRALARHRNFHILTVHEYTAITLPYTFLGTGGQLALNPDNMAVEKWQDTPIEIRRKSDGQLPDYWHLMRVGWLLIRADEIGVPRPDFIVTEGLWDNMDDLNIHDQSIGSGVLDWYRKRFNTDIRGIQSYPDVWAWMYPELSFEDATAYQLAWVDNVVYPKECKGIMLFAWNELWERQLHDYSHPEMYGVQDMLVRYANGEYDRLWGNANIPINGVEAVVWSVSANDVPIYDDNTYSRIVGHISPVGASYRVIKGIDVNGKMPLLDANTGLLVGYVYKDKVYVQGIYNPSPYVSDKTIGWNKHYVKSSWSGYSNVRLRPTTESPVVGLIAPSTPQLCYVRSSEGQYVDSEGALWYQVQYGSESDSGAFLGWVRSDVFSFVGESDETPELPQLPELVRFVFDFEQGKDSEIIALFNQIKLWYNNRN